MKEIIGNIEMILGLKTTSILFIASIAFLLGIILEYLETRGFLKEHKDIKRKAITDPLTGKGNRHKFTIDMDDLLQRKIKFAVCFMDLDGFKNINDTLGHDAR